MLAESGYVGQPVRLMAAQDIASHKAWGDIATGLLARLGMKVDFAAVDWGTLVAQAPQKSPPGQGGWQMMVTAFSGSDSIDPTNRNIRANVPGWPSSPQVESEIAAWFDSKTLDEEKEIARRLNKAALDHVVYAPLGHFYRYQAWRKNVTGIAQGPLPFLWGREQDGLELERQAGENIMDRRSFRGHQGGNDPRGLLRVRD